MTDDTKSPTPAIPEAAYVPKLIYYPQRDEYEFVIEDTAVVESPLVPDDSIGLLRRMAEPLGPVGFRIAGSLVRAATPAPADNGAEVRVKEDGNAKQ